MYFSLPLLLALFSQQPPLPAIQMQISQKIKNQRLKKNFDIFMSESIIDIEAFNRLVEFLPLESAKVAREAVEDCKLLYAHDRHFDLLAKLEGLIEEIARCEKELASSPTVVDITTAPEGSSSPNASTSLSAGLLKDLVETCVMHRVAQQKVKECKRLCDDIEDSSTWTPTTKIDVKGYGTYYRAEPGKNSHSFKVIGEVQESILHMASVIMELDLYTEWFPFCCEAVMTGEITRFHKSSRFVIQLPWPLANREVFLVGYGVDDLQHRKRIVIAARSVAPDEPLHPKITRPPVGKGNTRISVEIGGFLIEALSPAACRVSFIMNVDPEIAHVPMWLINWVSGKMIWVLLYQMGKAAKRAGAPGSKYTERRRSRPDIYVHFQERAVEIFAHHFPGEEVPSLDKPAKQ